MLALILTTIIFFAATNIDAIFLLITWFSQAKTTEQKRLIVAGQYLGFILPLALSLIGTFGALQFPEKWLGLLGLVPIYLGIQSLASTSTINRSNFRTKR